jgi:lipopolysaccharide export system permease protein
VTAGQVGWLTLTVLLHGSVFMFSALWLAKRHHNIHWRSWFSQMARGGAAGAPA